MNPQQQHTVPTGGLHDGPASTAPDASPRLDAKQTLSVGAMLGAMTIRRLISQRDDEALYVGFNEKLKRRFALREYLPSALAHRGPGGLLELRSTADGNAFLRGMQAFLERAERRAKLPQGVLLGVRRVWEENGTAYLCMPFPKAPSLAEVRLARSRPPDEHWLRERLLRPLLEALEQLHGAALCHGALAPEQVLMLPEGRTVLLDLASPPAVELALAQASDVRALASMVGFAMLGKPLPAQEPGSVLPSALLTAAMERGELPPYDSSLLTALDLVLAGPPGAAAPGLADFRAVLAGGRGDVGGDRDGAVGEPTPASPAAVAAPQLLLDQGRAPIAVDILLDGPPGAVPDLPPPQFTPHDEPALGPLQTLGPAEPAGDGPVVPELSPASAALNVSTGPSESAEPSLPPTPPSPPAPPAASFTAAAPAPAPVDPPPASRPAAVVMPAGPSPEAAVNVQPRRPAAATRPAHGSTGTVRPPASPANLAFQPAFPSASRPPRRAAWVSAGAMIVIAGLGLGGWVMVDRHGEVPTLSAGDLPTEPTSAGRTPAATTPAAAAPTGTAAPTGLGAPTGAASANAPPPLSSPAPAPAPATAIAPAPAPTAAATAGPAAVATAPAPPPAATAKPVARKPTSAAPASARTPPPRPVARTPAAPVAPATPRAVCGERTNFALYNCMQQQCRKPQFSKHAQCQALRERDEVD